MQIVNSNEIQNLIEACQLIRSVESDNIKIWLFGWENRIESTSFLTVKMQRNKSKEMMA